MGDGRWRGGGNSWIKARNLDGISEETGALFSTSRAPCSVARFESVDHGGYPTMYDTLHSGFVIELLWVGSHTMVYQFHQEPTLGTIDQGRVV